MAEVRNSAKQSAARARAREKAAGFREKQEELERLAADYFVAVDSLDEIETTVQRDIRAVQDRAAHQRTAARESASAAIGAMLELGISRNEIAVRLGIPLRDVKKPAGSPPTADTR